MTTPCIRTLALAIATLITGSAAAQGLGVPPDRRFLVPAADAQRARQAVQVIGTPVATINVTRAGADEPLAVALRTIVPRDYKVVIGAGINESLRTSWPASQPWPASLGTALHPLHLRAVIAHDSQEVLVQVAPRVNDEAPRPWAVLTGDGTVRRALTRWMSAAGLMLTWEPSGPVPVRADWSHFGTLDEALAALATDLASSEQPLCVRRYANGVVRVTTPEQCPTDPVVRPPLRPQAKTAPPASPSHRSESTAREGA